MRWFSKLIILWLLTLSPALAQNLGPPSGGGSGGPPTGAAGGDLSGTYPNPTVATFNNGAAIAPIASPTFTGVAKFPLGGASAPSIAGGTAGTTGEYFVANTGLGFSLAGVGIFDYGVSTSSQFSVTGSINASSNIFAQNAFIVGSGGGGVAITSGGASTIRFANNSSTALFSLSAPVTPVMQLGSVDASTATAQSLFVQSVVAGTSNVAGANFTIRGSLSTGSGGSGDIIFQTGGTGAAATVQNTATAALTIKGATQHIAYGGGSPVVSSCGTGTPGVDANATDTSGRITTGTVATSCTITFAKAYTTYNHCRITSQSAISGLTYSYTLSAITLAATALAGGLIDYSCDGI